MPQLPAEFRRQYRELGLPAADVLVLADELPTAQYFDAVLAAGTPAKPAANWIMGDIMAFCKARLPSCWLQCSPTNYGCSVQSMSYLLLQIYARNYNYNALSMRYFLTRRSQVVQSEVLFGTVVLRVSVMQLGSSKYRPTKSTRHISC